MGIRPQHTEAGENNTTCSWRNSNGFSPPNNEVCNLLPLPPEKALHMGCAVPGGLEKDELLSLTRDASATSVKTQQLVWARLVSQRHGPSQPFHTKIRDHAAIQPQQFPHPGHQDLPACHERFEVWTRHCLCIHPFIGVRVWACSLTKPRV